MQALEAAPPGLYRMSYNCLECKRTKRFHQACIGLYSHYMDGCPHSITALLYNIAPEIVFGAVRCSKLKCFTPVKKMLAVAN
jgi:hypothetical protein